MNWKPLLGFFWKHGEQISEMLPKSGTAGQSSLLLDVTTALAPVVKKHWPQLNANGLCDDAVTTMKEVLAPPAA